MKIFSSVGSRRRPVGGAARRCRFEQMEPRQLLAADLVGAVPPLHSPGAIAGTIQGNVYAAVEGATVGMAQVRVQLLNETGAVIEESLTDAQGGYQFSGLIPGVYALQEQTPVGYSDGLSQAGSGGGVVFNPNLFGEIFVEAGETLSGYDFYDALNVVEQNSDGDPLIVAHGGEGVGRTRALPILGLSLQSTPERASDVSLRSSFVAVAGKVVGAQKTSLLSREESAFGGSSQEPARVSAVEALEDESPFEGIFSLTGFWELASANLPTLKPLEQLYEDVGLGLQELLGELYIPSRQSESAATEQVEEPRIASRYDRPETLEPKPGKTENDEHAEAVDEIFAAENFTDARS